MDITNLSIRNFLTIGHAELELGNRGLLLIQGKNEDDTSAASNGAGKSSIVDALCWCLYGTTARDVTGDDVVNATAKKDCEVAIMLVDGGMEYRIVRYRKHKVAKNALTVSQRDLTTGVGTDLSKGTDKETQEVVRKIMGCSLDVFIGAIYAGQERMPDLPGMTDKQLKLLIEEAAGVEELASAYQEASRQALAAKKDFDAAGAYVKTVEQRREQLDKELADAKANHKDFEDGRKDRARIELARVKPLEEGLAEARTNLAAYDQPALTARKATLEFELSAHAKQQAEMERLIALERKAIAAVASARTAAEGEKRRLDLQSEALADIESQVGNPCGECGKAYCEHDLEGAKKARQTAIDATKSELQAKLRILKDAMTERQKAEADIEAYKVTMTDVSAASAELTKIGTDLDTAAELRADIAEWQRDIKTIKLAAKSKLTETNPWTRAVEAKEADIERCDKELARACDELQKYERRADLLADAAKVFGPAGVRAHILDTVTPFLNERTGDYLGALADGNIHATWSTLASTAKGELKEKFNIDVTNDKGGKSFKALSGGEKRKVRIASNMALQDMVASRAEKPINLWIGDEIDHALDEPGLERLMTVLDRKAKERGTVVVISHNALDDWIDNVIQIKKSGGVSTVMGATHRGF